MNFCWLDIHKYNKYEEFSKSNFVSMNRNVEKFTKVVQKRACKVCGENDFSEKNVIGYGK